MVLLTVTSFFGCARQTRGGDGGAQIDAAGIENVLREVVAISEFKGFGDIAIVASGQNMTGTIDAARRNTGFVRAQIYTPFGSAIATIAADDSVGSAVVNRQRFDFTYAEAVDETSFPAARHFTYGQFISTVTGSMPEIFWELPANSPDTLTRSRRRGGVTASWLSDTLTVRATVSTKTGRLDNIAFNYNMDGNTFSIRFSHFRRGIPYEITLRESSRNYITVKYESITWK